ncbi:hypothetical protein FB451DRAFT_1243528 [Mycena latifolia]|nr:hypothetical protein FB451DRAFT_1243528 [Mycena latifolia]
MGRHIDRLVLWYATLLAVVLLGVFNAMQLATSGLSIGAAIVVAFALDLFRQPLQAPLARTVLRYALALPTADSSAGAQILLGQVMGTSAGAASICNTASTPCSRDGSSSSY